MLQANPLGDIRNTRRIEAIVFGDKLLRRADLDRMLSDVAHDAKEE